jgi:hypothetical protein
MDHDLGRQEVLNLAALVRECVASGIGRNVCIVHLSRLPADRIRPHHLRLARAALEPLANADRARVFELPNRDIVAIWRGAATTAVTTSRAAIAHLFDLPPKPIDGPDDTDFACLTAEPSAELWEELSLPDQSAALSGLTDMLLTDSQTPIAPSSAASPLDTQTLAALEAGLAQADVARFARRRQICQRLPDGSFRLRWEKRFLSVEEITESLVPHYAPQADSWLFRRLTRTLDRRMLALLAAPGELEGAGPFAVNLNVASILSPEFLRLDEALPKTLRGHVTIDLLAEDILADPAAFMFARDFAQSRAYRLLLRGITADLLPVFDLGQIGLDLMQLRWSPNLTRLSRAPLAAVVDRIVLSHADTSEAIAWGVSHGISKFQGRQVISARGRAS